MSLRQLAVLLLVAPAAWVLPATAAAVTVRVPTVGISPHLDGQRVVWGELDDGRLRVRSADGAGSRALGAVTLRPGRTAADLALGGGGVYVSQTSYDPDGVRMAPLRYTLAQLGQPAAIDCASPEIGFGGQSTGHRIAGDAVTLASPGAACRGDAILVRTPGLADRAVREPGIVLELRVDGGWLAAIVDIGGTGWLVVHDLGMQRESYRVALGDPYFARAPQTTIDVDGDGSAVVGEPRLFASANGSFVKGPGCELWWASPAQPSRHVLPLAGCSAVALHDGVLALTLRDGPLTALVATDLAARRQITVRRAARIGAIDLSADRVAWSEQSCRNASYVRTAPLRAERRRASAGCVIRVRSRGPLRMDAHGAVRVRVDCPDGCDGFIYALRCNHRGCLPHPRRVRLAARRSAVVRFVLTAQARRLVRRGARRVLIKTYSSVGPTVAVTRTITARSTRR